MRITTMVHVHESEIEIELHAAVNDNRIWLNIKDAADDVGLLMTENQLELLAEEIGAHLDKLYQQRVDDAAAATDKAIAEMLSCG